MQQGLSDEQKDTLAILKDTLAEVLHTESGTCRLCGHVVRGTSFAEIFQRLGVHGERAHQEYWRQQAAKWK